MAKEIQEVKKLEKDFEREAPLEFGVRHCVCVRETKQEARRAVEGWLSGSDIGNTATWADSVRLSESTSQSRINEMASRESLWLTDTIWMGVNKVRAGGATTFVGTPEMVANQFRRIHRRRRDAFHHARLALSGGSGDFRSRGIAAAQGRGKPVILPDP